MTHRTLQLSAWLLTVAVVAVSVMVWWPSSTNRTSAYTIFPLFGLLAFGLMWVHYVSGALRILAGAPETTLRTHYVITSYFVLFFLLAHPLVLEVQLYRDGFGLPPANLFLLYAGTMERIALLAGITALTLFLVFELHRWFRRASWWVWVERLNKLAMLLVLWHGFSLGGELRTPWFQTIWLGYTLTFLVAIAYTKYHKERIQDGI